MVDALSVIAVFTFAEELRNISSKVFRISVIYSMFRWVFNLFKIPLLWFCCISVNIFCSLLKKLLSWAGRRKNFLCTFPGTLGASIAMEQATLCQASGVCIFKNVWLQLQCWNYAACCAWGVRYTQAPPRNAFIFLVLLIFFPLYTCIPSHNFSN